MFRLSEINQGIYKHAIQKKYELLAFLKKSYIQKRKKNYIKHIKI